MKFKFQISITKTRLKKQNVTMSSKYYEEEERVKVAYEAASDVTSSEADSPSKIDTEETLINEYELIMLFSEIKGWCEFNGLCLFDEPEISSFEFVELYKEWNDINSTSKHVKSKDKKYIAWREWYYIYLYMLYDMSGFTRSSCPADEFFQFVYKHSSKQFQDPI